MLLNKKWCESIANPLHEKKVILIFVLLHFSCLLIGQDLCKKKEILEPNNGIVSAGSTSVDHLSKFGIFYDLREFSCSIDNNNSLNFVFTVNQQADLIYFENYYDTTHILLKEQGYYRLKYSNAETGYCWAKDLVWNQFDKNGVLINKEFYDEGKIKESPAMPQPKNKIKE